MSTGTRERAAVVALLRAVAPSQRCTLASEIMDRGADEALIRRLAPPDTLFAGTDLVAAALREAARLVASWERAGIQVLTCSATTYPERLRAVAHPPPLLFARGELANDALAVAVVGTRRPSPRGLRLATDVASGLAAAGVTVVSGLAAGIDTAAHVAALAARGRTVAVLGTGVRRAYPLANAGLQDAIARKGLLLSQFFPDEPPARSSFLMRNAVMSGYCAVTVVIEAARYSGARAQARMALEQGRVVVLPAGLLAQEWARDYSARPGVHVAGDANELVAAVCEMVVPVRPTPAHVHAPMRAVAHGTVRAHVRTPTQQP